MPKYTIQKEIKGWGDGWTILDDFFDADDDEDAKRKVAEIVNRRRYHFSEASIRVLRVVFEGHPATELGYPIYDSEKYQKARELELAAEARTFLYHNDKKNKKGKTA